MTFGKKIRAENSSPWPSLGIKKKFYMHVQNLVGKSPLHFPLSSLPLCSLLHTNFSIKWCINWLPSTALCSDFFACRRKFQSLPGCFLWPVWYQFSILLKVYLVRVVKCTQCLTAVFIHYILFSHNIILY